MSLQEEKKRIRIEAKKRRSLVDREKKDLRIAETVLHLKEYQETDQIYTYVSFRDEVDTSVIIETSWRRGKHVFCPVVSGNEMEFFQVFSWDDFLPGMMGILEPRRQKSTDIKREGFMVMPGLAFDWECRRIGYGGGYYDRYLQKYKEKFVTAALAYSEQMWEQLPTEELDIRPDMIITEEGIINGFNYNGAIGKKSSGMPEYNGKHRKE